jgi:hypothetical protein
MKSPIFGACGRYLSIALGEVVWRYPESPFNTSPLQHEKRGRVVSASQTSLELVRIGTAGW